MAEGKKFRISFNSPVILTFTAISFAVTVLGYLTNGASNQLLFSTYRGSLLDPLMYVRMFTHVLGHSSFDHWLGNFLIILIVGPMIEEKYGSKKTLLLIVITAFATALVNNLLFSTGILGASGVAFAMILLSSFTSYEEGSIPATLILVAILYIGKEVIAGFSVDDISQLSHIIGGIIGCCAGFALNRTGSKSDS